jgi:hypothetical protein
MRWPVKNKDTRPLHGVIRYRLKFAFTPVETVGVSGSYTWDAEMIWLEKVVEVQTYYRVGTTGGGWIHERWYPVNEFTISLYEHNNQ